MSEIERLRQQVDVLKAQLEGQRKTNDLLKKRLRHGLLRVGETSPVSLRQVEAAPMVSQAGSVHWGKSLFLENISHEIRSAMNGILGMSDLIQETELSVDQKSYLDMIGSSVTRLLEVMDEVLDFSKIESGELDLKYDDFNLKESLDHDLYVLSVEAHRKKIELNCHIDDDVPAYVSGDAVRLTQLVANIVNNGIKYTDRGSVSLNIENRGYDSANNLILSFRVTDTGCGLTPEAFDLISYYLKQKVNSQAPLLLNVGTGGLGLTVASQLVKLMGGEIGVQSSDKGATFWFTLPFKEVADFSSFEEKANSTFENIKESGIYALKGARILLAEDEYINRVLIETVLEQLGVNVTSVENGEAAIKEAIEGDYQLILMDIQMPGVDGLEAAKAIRKHERKTGKHVDIVALTALAMAGDREKCLQAGMDDYLPKPAEKNQLIEVLTKFLTNKALVVESDQANQDTMVKTLIESGWGVTIAETRRSAMYEACLTHFGLILFDMSMPHGQSAEAIDILRRLEEYLVHRTVIVGIGDTRDSGELAGVDGYIQRPVTAEKIREKLESLGLK